MFSHKKNYFMELSNLYGTYIPHKPNDQIDCYSKTDIKKSMLEIHD
jgi:hypothetical protein